MRTVRDEDKLREIARGKGGFAPSAIEIGGISIEDWLAEQMGIAITKRGNATEGSYGEVVLELRQIAKRRNLLTVDEVFRAYLRRGVPREEALVRAEEWVRRQQLPMLAPLDTTAQ